jgi:hypothetical protein
VSLRLAMEKIFPPIARHFLFPMPALLKILLICLLYGFTAVTSLINPFIKSPKPSVMVNGTDDFCIRPPADPDVQYFLSFSQTKSNVKYSDLDPKGIRASRITMKLISALEKLNMRLKNQEGLLDTDASSLGKLAKGRFGKTLRKILERLKQDSHKTKSRRDVNSKVDKMLAQLTPMVREILSALLSRHGVRVYLNQQLNDKKSPISVLIGDEYIRTESIRRLKQLNRDPTTRFSSKKGRRNENATSETPHLQSCCDCHCSNHVPNGIEPVDTKSCLICFDEITANNRTLNLNCPHSGDFHRTVCLY